MELADAVESEMINAELRQKLEDCLKTSSKRKHQMHALRAQFVIAVEALKFYAESGCEGCWLEHEVDEFPYKNDYDGGLRAGETLKRLKAE